MYGREAGVDLDLCDVCYWRKRADIVVALLGTVAGLPVADYSTDGDGAELVRQDSVLAAIKTAIGRAK